MGKGSSRRQGKGYDEGFERIFGKDKKPEKGGRFAYDKDAQRLVRLPDRDNRDASVAIVGDIEPFKSPITGEIISSRSQLREHHKQHGTTDARDYSQEHFDKKAKEHAEAFNGATKADRKDRIDRIRHQLDRRR